MKNRLKDNRLSRLWILAVLALSAMLLLAACTTGGDTDGGTTTVGTTQSEHPTESGGADSEGVSSVDGTSDTVKNPESSDTPDNTDTTDTESGTDKPAATGTESADPTDTDKPTDTDAPTDTDEPTDTDDVNTDNSETSSEDSSEGETTNDLVIETVTTKEATTTEKPADTSLVYPDVDPADYEGVFISKVYGNGGKSDAAAEHSFIELYNSTDKEVSLFGLSLYCKSGGADPFAQFPFPKDATIAPGAHYLVRGKAASKYDRSYAVLRVESYDVEWKYSIDNNEYRLMLAPVGLVLPKDTDVLTHKEAISSIITIPDGEYHQSIYAVDNMSKNKVAVRTALESYSGFHKINLSELSSTELLNNAPKCSQGIGENGHVTSRLSEVHFSVPAGIYEKQFTLNLSAPAGYDIYYTTDGEDPRVSGKKYAYGLMIRDGTNTDWSQGNVINRFMDHRANAAKPTTSTLMGGRVIKAYATNGTDSTPVYTSTYFVIPKLAELDITVMAMSMPTEEFVGDNGFYVNYGNGLDAPRPRGMAVMEVFDKDGVRVGYSNIEAAISGHGSSGWAMKSMRLYWKGSNNTEGGMMSDLDYDLFRGECIDAYGQNITSFSRLLLRNSGNDAGESMFRDAYMQSASAELGADYMEYAPVFLFVNGEFWGVYNARERYSGDYVESHYGVNKDNVTILENDYSQVQSNKNAPYIVSSGLQEDADHFNNLITYIKSNDLTNKAVYDYVCSQIDVDSLIATYVSRLFFAAPDWPDNNIKIWRNRDPYDPSGVDTKWHFTLLDLDFGLHTEHSANWSSAIGSTSVCSNLMAKLLTNTEFKNKFAAAFYNGVTYTMTQEKNLALLQEMGSERLTLMPYIVARWGNEGRTVDEFRTEWAEMKSLLSGNKNTLSISGMRNFLRLSEAELEAIVGKNVSLSFNPARVSVTVDGKSVENGDRIHFDNSQTYSIVISVNNNYEFTNAVVSYSDGTTKTFTTPTFAFTASTSCTITVNAKKPSSNMAKGKLIAGASYMFYLSDDGELYGWGDNTNGVLGVGGSIAQANSPTFVMSNVKKVSTTDSTNYEQGATTWATAILTNDGKLYTVGCNGSGQLGRGGTTNDLELGLVSFDGTIVDVSMGYDHMLVIDDKGNLWGVGNNGYGQIRANGASSQTFVKIATGVTMANASRRSTVYVTTSGDMYGLGDNRWNKMVYDGGVGDAITTPKKLLSGVKFIDAGEHQLLVITNDGALYYAGWRTFSGFSTGNGNNPAFHKVAASGVVDADIYYDNMAVLTEDGEVLVYGNNTGSALGASSTGGSLVPTTITSGIDIIDVAVGYDFTAFLSSDGTIYVHGSNSHAQGGLGHANSTLHMSEVPLNI